MAKHTTRGCNHQLTGQQEPYLPPFMALHPWLSAMLAQGWEQGSLAAPREMMGQLAPLLSGWYRRAQGHLAGQTHSTFVLGDAAVADGILAATKPE